MKEHSDDWCGWYEDSDHFWGTSCGSAFEFNEGGPDENGFTFCPYCGLAIQQFVREDEDDELPQEFYGAGEDSK
jgi:hypothetical protein